MSKSRSPLDYLSASPSSSQDGSPGQVHDASSLSRDTINIDSRRQLAEIRSAMQKLTRQMDATGDSINSKPGSTSSSINSSRCNAAEFDTDAFAGSLSGFVRENIHDQIAGEIDKMRQKLGILQQNADRANNRTVLDEIQRISEGIHELQSLQSVSPDQIGEMAGALRGIHHDTHPLAEQGDRKMDRLEISSIIRIGYDKIAQKLDRLGSSRSGDHFVALSEKLAAIKESIRSTDAQTLLKIEDQLKAIKAAISSLVNENPGGPGKLTASLDVTLRGYFERLDLRLDEITRAILASSSVEKSGFDHSAFERIEARVASLAKSVDNMAIDGIPLSDHPQLTDLKLIPEQLRSALARFETSIAEISMSPIGEETPNSGEISAQLACLVEKIDQLQSASAIPAEHGPMEAEFGAKLDSLSLALEQATNCADGSVDQLDTQICELSKRVELAISTNQAIQQTILDNNGDDQASPISALAQDLKFLSQSASELKGRGLETFDAVHASLSTILDRVNAIEDRMANEIPSSGSSSPDPASTDEIRNADIEDTADDFASGKIIQKVEAEYQKTDTQTQDDDKSDLDQAGDELNLQFVEKLSRDFQKLPHTQIDFERAPEPVDNDSCPEPGADIVDSTEEKTNLEAPKGNDGTAGRHDIPGDEQQIPTEFIAAVRRATLASAKRAILLDNAKDEETAKNHEFSIVQTFLFKKSRILPSAAIIVLAVLAFAMIWGLPNFKSLRFVEKIQNDQSTQIDPIGQIPTNKSSTSPAPARPEIATEGSKSQLPENRQASEFDSASGHDRFGTPTPELHSVEQEQSNERQKTASTPDTDLVSLKRSQLETSLLDHSPKVRQLPSAPEASQDVGPIALRQAAAGDDPKAIFEIGRRYATGINGIADFAESIKWFKRAAISGHPPAQHRLGMIYENGHGVTPDLNKAAKWYRRAAKRGNTLSMYNLAVLNALGVLDGGTNMGEAISWFRKAAEYGVKDSQVNLGIIHANGMGVDLDLVKAYKWFSIAAISGDRDAAQKRDSVGKKLRPDQLELARDEIALWQPRDLDVGANSVDIPAEWVLSPKPSTTTSSSRMIEKTQTILTKLGFDPGARDGLMGAKTTEAIKQFQARAGIAVDGKVTPELISALEKSVL